MKIGLDGTGKENEKNHRKIGSYKKVKSKKSLAIEQDLEHAFKGLPLESSYFPFSFFSFSCRISGSIPTSQVCLQACKLPWILL